jgi:NAD(P)-dependent dehydrogenase (short-subunit alcohol dehydrogenase family)
MPSPPNSPLDLFRLDGKCALITGGSKGLGKTMAMALAQAGAELALASRNLAECRNAADEIASATSKKVTALQADVTRPADIDRLAREAESALGRIDILINNAGINIRGDSDKLTEADWDAVVNVNLKAPFLLTRLLGPKMCKRRWGRVINMGSILSVIGIAGRAPYAAAKGGLLNMTRVFALEYAPHNVMVNAICPGPFLTEINKPVMDDPQKYKAFCEKIPLGRFGQVKEIIGPALFLASEASSFVTGSALFVDGGWTAQ